MAAEHQWGRRPVFHAKRARPLEEPVHRGAIENHPCGRGSRPWRTWPAVRGLPSGPDAGRRHRLPASVTSGTCWVSDDAPPSRAPRGGRRSRRACATLSRSSSAVAGATPPSSWPGDRRRPSISAVVDGLPRSWQTAPSIMATDGPRVEIGDARSGLVDHHERVDPDVAFRMPLRFLRTIDQRVEFRPEPGDDGQIARERKTDRGTIGEEEQFLDFAPDALGGQVVEGNRSEERPGFGVDARGRNAR